MDPIPFQSEVTAADLPPVDTSKAHPMAVPFVSPEIHAARARNSLRRSAAMCLDTDLVIGMRLRPLCPATHSFLQTCGSPFLSGRTVMPSDVQNYVWFHSPHFEADNDAKRESVMREFQLHAMRVSKQPIWRKWGVARLTEGYGEAIAAIQELVEITFADAPVATDDDRDTPATAACLEAQIVNTFARAYPQWSVEYVRWQPLRRLYQYLRCLRADGGARDMDRDETQITVDFLKAMNAKNAAERAAS